MQLVPSGKLSFCLVDLNYYDPLNVQFMVFISFAPIKYFMASTISFGSPDLAEALSFNDVESRPLPKESLLNHDLKFAFYMKTLITLSTIGKSSCCLIVGASQFATLKIIMQLILHFKILLTLTNRVVLTINGHDTSYPLGTWFRPFTNCVCDTKYHRRCT